MSRRKPRVWRPVVIPEDVSHVKDPDGRVYERWPAAPNSWALLGPDGRRHSASISTASLVGLYGPLTEVIPERITPPTTTPESETRG